MKQLKTTRACILDVAEDLFAEQGFDRVSIRDITKQARVNLAAINYHFGGKEDLIVAARCSGESSPTGSAGQGGAIG